MDVPTQPPADVPAPQPGREAIRSRRVKRWIIGVGILSLLGLVSAPLVDRVVRKRIICDETENANNARQLHLALFNFDSDFGKFPDASTIADVKKATGTDIPLGASSSNEIFRQLIAAKSIRSESIFWVKSTISPRKPDNDISGSRALEKGECGFAYVAGASLSGMVGRPILLAPVDPARRCFERRDDYNNSAIITFIDGSAKSFPVDEHGRVEIGGMDFFDPRQPFWDGKEPDVKWPE